MHETSPATGCFAALEKAGLIGDELTARLRQMARFQNLLVHVYWHLDDNQVHEVLQRDVNDLAEFSAIIAALV